MKRFLSAIFAIVLLLSSFSAYTIFASATTYSPTIKTGTYATIKNVGSGKMLNVYGSKSANNTNITVYAKDNTSGQDVKAYSANGGYYFTFRCSTSRALNIYGTSCKESANVCIWNITKNPTQIWTIEYVPSKDAYILRSKSNSSYCLTANGSSNSSNVCIKKYTGSTYQLWTSSLFNKNASNASTQTTTNSSSKTYLWPCSASASITGKYGTNRGDHIHAGIDIGLAKNAPVYATCAGVVIAVKNDSSGPRGRYVVVYHKDLNVSSLYQHLQSTCVSVGSNVSQGQTIGKAGGSGYGKDSYYANHLHFELKKGKQTTSNAYNFDPTPNKVIKYKNK